jgi:hypothetical protein
LAAFLLPVLSMAKVKALRTGCQSNLRQLGFGWWVYKDDNSGLLVQSYPTNNPQAWVQGDMSVPEQAVDTGLLRQGKLFPYAPNAAVFRCPADRSTVPLGSRRQARVRSYSMNALMGGRDGEAANSVPRGASIFTRDTEIPQPARTWVLLDEDEKSISDGWFLSDTTGKQWLHNRKPAFARHRRSFSICFADGHTDSWQRVPRIASSTPAAAAPVDGPDIQRLSSSSAASR